MAQGSSGWHMAGGNPERTSWVSEEVRGRLGVEWYKPIEPYISPKVQVIASNGFLYIATASGLYAIDADTGAEAWVYPTELPLGHSPTVAQTPYGSRVYVGGLDHKIHCLDALPDISSLPTDPDTSQSINSSIWIFEAEGGEDSLGAGFDTNPLVVDIQNSVVIFAGNRDGYMYAIEDNGDEAVQYWTTPFQTGGPIHYSAAFRDNVIYFAANDAHAYALNASTGNPVWNRPEDPGYDDTRPAGSSPKLPGAGFHSWWPVIYDDPDTGWSFVIFSGSLNYRQMPPYASSHKVGDHEDIYQNEDGTYPEPYTPVGPVTIEQDGSTTIDASKITEYFEEPSMTEKRNDPAGLGRKGHKSWRRTVFYLDLDTGEEYSFDTDGDGRLEYAPILYQGTHSGNRFPPIVGSDGIVYQANNYYYYPWQARGSVAGWDVGTDSIIKVPGHQFFVDEPIAYSSGGDLIYVRHCGDRSAMSFDVNLPGLDWIFWDMGGNKLRDQIPGYDFLMFGQDKATGGDCWATYGTRNGIYGYHGDQNPPIPYRGRVYLHASNVIVALSESGVGSDVGLPLAEMIPASESSSLDIAENDLKILLEAEVSRMVLAGHLQPGFISTGRAEGKLNFHGFADNPLDYWRVPGDTFYVLIRAYPHLSVGLQKQVKDYLNTEFTRFPLDEYINIGWVEGAQREVFNRPPEVEYTRLNELEYAGGPLRWRARTSLYYTNFTGWTYPPYQFYAMWKYADLMGDPSLSYEMFTDSKDRLDTPPTDDYLVNYPYVHNAYIAGYLGYLELGKMAGLTDQDPDIQAKHAELDRLLRLRVSSFSKDTPFGDSVDNCYGRELSVSRNFMYLVPELADYLRDNIRTEIEAAVTEYENVAPYWFVSKYEASAREGVISALFNRHALFQAKAQILQQPQGELIKYLDVPGVKTGDLYYIDNLVAAIEARP